MKETLDLDALARENGEVIKKPQTIENISDSVAEQMTVQASRAANNYVYDSGSPTPGESIDNELNRILDVDKTNINDKLIKEAAIMKAHKESTQSLTPEERARKKQEVCDYLLYQAEQQYYEQHHYIMDGRTKRRTRLKISRDYDKGRYRPRNGRTLND